METKIEFIKEIAYAAGRQAEAERGKLSSEQIHAKASAKDMVTEVDRQVEDFLIRKIHERYPDHDVFGEETGESGHSGRCRWIIDPIDGTTSYIHGYPFYSVSIALEEDGELTAGAVYVPPLDEMFYAGKGQGAWLNGRKITVSNRALLVESLLATGFACVRANLPENNLPVFNRVMPVIRGIRRSGSAAVDLAYVACGRLDGFWEMNLNLYDIAAGVLLIREAGGKITDMTGGDNYPAGGIIATNGRLHDALSGKIQEKD